MVPIRWLIGCYLMRNSKEFLMKFGGLEKAYTAESHLKTKYINQVMKEIIH